VKKFVMASLLIGAVVLYSGYSLITSSDNSNDTDKSVDLSEITQTYKYSNTSSNDKFIGEKNNTSNNEENTQNLKDSRQSTFASEGSIATAENDSNTNDTEMNGRGPVIETVSTRTSSVVTTETRLSLMEKIFVHRVESGDNLWEIASKYNIDIDTLIGANDITNINTIQIGDKIKILPVKGILYKVNPGESLWTIARQFSISIDAIVEANALINPDLVKPGMLLVLPDAKPEVGYKDRISKNFISPIKGRISSFYGPRWGKMHEGIDWAVNTGTKVRAARSGKVVYSEWSSGYGYTVVIEHQKGVRTLYAHNSKLLVHGGQWVERGQVISLSGNTGRSTGPHLHFEIQINGKPVNPLNYIQ